MTLGTKAFIVRATAGDRVVFNDGYRLAGGIEVADLKAAGASGAASPVVIASAARASFELSADRSRVIYVLPGASGGLYVATLP